MEPTDANPISPDCFQLQELEKLQACEGALLADVNYYLWLNQPSDGSAPIRFLYFLELLFETEEPLLLSSGEDSTAILVSDPATLVKTAGALQRLQGQISIQRLSAFSLPLWAPAVGQTLKAVRLSKNEQGLYLNDALLLDFGSHKILVQISPEKEGLQLGLYE